MSCRSASVGITAPSGLAFMRCRVKATRTQRQANAPVTALDQFAAQKLRDLEARQLRRSLADTARTDGIHVLRNGRRLVSFSCNDYLNLSHHPKVKEAAIAALERYGAGAGASRLVSGNHPLFG